MSTRLANLDLLRGLAALMVVASHLRAFLFVDFGQAASPGISQRLFYFATGLGHQAVVVFFVLSGFLVGGSVLAAYRAGRWSWKSYALRRMSRLWVVLIPALALTFALDGLGRHLGHVGYEGAFQSIYNSGPGPSTPSDLRATTLLGNALFLQTIEVGCFGTNGPLWSLANEFWYYVLFPLLCSAAFPGYPALRILSLIIAVVVMRWLPDGLLWSGLLWLLGAGAFAMGRFAGVRKICGHPAWLVSCGLFAMGSLALSKTRSILGSDLAIGVAFAAWLIGLAAAEHQVHWLRKLSAGLSDISYSLYLFHFPILAFVFFGFFEGRRFPPTVGMFLGFVALMIGCVALSALLWWCFERNTDRARRFVEALLGGRGRGLVGKNTPTS